MQTNTQELELIPNCSVLNGGKSAHLIEIHTYCRRMKDTSEFHICKQ
ncbi:hypothetical protein BwiPL1_58100 (plasmid) [Bacillus wiedmannii]|nr:hypothetical protein BwiPL1_58100 [Bacillus wiedmannii]